VSPHHVYRCLLAAPPEGRALLDSGVLVVNHQVEYLRPIDFGDRPLVIKLWVDQIGGSLFTIGYDVLDGDDLAARARSGLAPFDLAHDRLRRLTDAERAMLTRHLAPAEPLPPVGKARSTGHDHRFPLRVRWSDLDSYGHANNVKFYDYIQEARIALIHETVGWESADVWMVARQDLEYRKPLDFRPEPYEVGTFGSAIGTRSFTLEATIRDPASGTVFATARTVAVGVAPLSEGQRSALAVWSTRSG
jgi:acyl-CoA thioester hydrolase